MPPYIVYVILVILIATLVRSTFGFGESLVAVPLLILLIPKEVAVPLAVLISAFVAGVIMIQDRRQVHIYSAKWLIIYAAIGIPFGLLLLIYANAEVVQISLGILIAAYALYSLFSKNKFRLKSDNKLWLFACGFISGILGGAYGLNGPPLVIYGNLRRWTPQHFRATLQAYFLPASVLGLIGYAYNGLVTAEIGIYFALCLPVILIAIFAGRYLNKKLSQDRFLKYVFVGLTGIGVLLVVKAIL